MRQLPALVLCVLIVLGCGSGGSTQLPSATPRSNSSPGSTVTPEPVASPSPPATTSAKPTPSGLGPEMVAEVVTDDLRVRTAPGVSDTSMMLEPLLSRGTMLYVVEGPVEATGYDWFRVQTLGMALTEAGDDIDQEQIEQGWIAAADKNGEVWLDVAEPTCPPAPAGLEDLVDADGSSAVDPLTAVACFDGLSISFEAQILDCQASPELESASSCEMDTGSPSFQPVWFDRTFRFLSSVHGPFEERSMLELHADPDGSYPDPMVFGEPVLVTGQFNHPEAGTCTVYHYFQDDQPTAHCRTAFAVTRIELLGS